jgi:SOS-response transcriptional repressor LexA
LESLLDIDGFHHPPTIADLAAQALEVFRRRRRFITDIRKDLRQIDEIDPGKWLSYWNGNPINAWTGGNRSGDAKRWFEVSEGRFQATFPVSDEEQATFQEMVQELVDYRLAAYEPRLPKSTRVDSEQVTGDSAKILPFSQPPVIEETEGTEVPYFRDLRVACGHFRTGRTDVEATYRVPPGHGRIDPNRHFVARATGNSMNGGKNPVRDGDYLLLEWVGPSKAGSITGNVIAIERQDNSGDDQYLLRLVTKRSDGRYVLKAANPDYPDFEANEEMRTLARLRAVWDGGG